MKKLIFIFGLILFNSCTASTTAEEENLVSGKDRVVRMEFNTTLLSFDEIRISYFDYKTNTNPLSASSITNSSST